MALRLALILFLVLGGFATRAPAQDADTDTSPSPDLFDDDGGDGDDGGGDTEGRKYYSFGARGGVWLGLLEGRARFPVARPLIDGRFTADIEDEDVVMPFGEVFLTLKYVSLYADYWQGEFEDDTSGTGTFTFQGTTFSGSVPVHTELDVISFGARLQVNPIAWDLVEVGISFGGRYLQADGRLSGEGPGGGTVEESDRIEVPIPQVGASVTFFVGRMFDIYVRARGIAGEWEEHHVKNIEGELGFAFNIGDHFSIGAEYRAFYLEYDDESDNEVDDDIDAANVDVALHGPLVYVRLRF